MKTSAFNIFDLRSSNFVSPLSPPGSGFEGAIELLKDFSGSTSLFSVILEMPEGEYFHPVWQAREAEITLWIGSENLGPAFFKDFKKSMLSFVLGEVFRKVSFSFGISGRPPSSALLATMTDSGSGGGS